MERMEDLLDIPYIVHHRPVKRARLQLRSGTLEVILPFGEDAATMVGKHLHWVQSKTRLVEEYKEMASGLEFIDRTWADFKLDAIDSVRGACAHYGVELNSVIFRKMRTKWASCSSRRNITLNSLMRYLPERLIDYIAHHEAAHMIRPRHDKEFFGLLETRFVDIRSLEKELLAYWFKLAGEPVKSGTRRLS